MIYYKIPATSGFTYPRGCILRRAYPYAEYMYCEFENVVSIGSNWVELTASDFNANYPNVKPIVPVFVEQVTAINSQLSNSQVVLTLPTAVQTGTIVKFKSPCSCGQVTGGLVVHGETYALLDSLKQPVSANSLMWEANALISVIMDVEEKQAFVQDMLHIYES